MLIQTFIIGAFFCYGIYTLQRPSFLFDFVPKFWKLLPKGLHEPLFGCGVCVSSIWGFVFLTLDYFHIYLVCYPIAFCGFCAVIDRAVKFFEYGYNYKNTRGLSKPIHGTVCTTCNGSGSVLSVDGYSTHSTSCPSCLGAGIVFTL